MQVLVAKRQRLAGGAGILAFKSIAVARRLEQWAQEEACDENFAEKKSGEPADQEKLAISHQCHSPCGETEHKRCQHWCHDGSGDKGKYVTRVCFSCGKHIPAQGNVRADVYIVTKNSFRAMWIEQDAKETSRGNHRRPARKLQSKSSANGTGSRTR